MCCHFICGKNLIFTIQFLSNYLRVSVRSLSHQVTVKAISCGLLLSVLFSLWTLGGDSVPHCKKGTGGEELFSRSATVGISIHTVAVMLELCGG